MSNTNKIDWHAPKWSAVGKKWWELKKCLLSAGPLARIFAASIATCGLIIVGFKIAFPGIVIPNLLPLLFVFPVLVGQVTLQTYFTTQMRPRVAVTPKKIVISHGQSVRTIQRDQLTSIVLAIHDDEKSRLRLRYERRGKSQLTTIGLSHEVSLIELERILAMEITPRDYRRTKQYQRSSSDADGITMREPSDKHAPHLNPSENFKISCSTNELTFN